MRANLLGEFVFTKCPGETDTTVGDCIYGETGERNIGLWLWDIGVWLTVETGDAIGLCHFSLETSDAIAPGDLLGENIIEGGILILILDTRKSVS